MAPRRFAPLKEATTQTTTSLPKLEGVVFDVDGTLCEPQNHMFAEMRAVLGIPKSVDILEHVYALPTPAQQAEAQSAIRDIERRNMAQQVAQPGLGALMAHLDARRVRKAICTRNFDAPVQHLLDNFLPGSKFEPIITREFRPPKPDPAGILFIARSWGLVRRSSDLPDPEEKKTREAEKMLAESAHGQDPAAEDAQQGRELVGDASHLIMVGDSVDDMTAGRRAGAATVLLVNPANQHLAEHEHTDLVISRLDELVCILDDGFVGRDL